MRFSIQSIKKLVTTGTWKIGGTWDAIGFVGLAMGVAVCLVDSRSFAITCLAAVKSRGGEGNLRDNGTDGRSILSSPTRIRGTHHTSHCFEIRETNIFDILYENFSLIFKKDLFRILIERDSDASNP